MASQPSVHNEERNRLRLRAWEQRNQEASQAKKVNPESVPLFGEPYKTKKGDELSSRIQRMLGSYEDVNSSSPFSTDPLPPTYGNLSKSEQCEPDKSTKPPFHTQAHYISFQNQDNPCSNSSSSQPMAASTASFSPIQHGHLNDSGVNDSQLDPIAHEQNKSEAFSDLRDCVSIPQEKFVQSPDVKPIDCLQSSNHSNTDTDTKVIFDGHQVQGPPEPLSACASTIDVSTLNVKQSPKDASLPHANRTNTLPSQAFPLLLSSKQPSVVTTQKPTAYVRPMDGQDQVPSESPELKPSPEPYAPLPELLNKSDQGKLKILPQFLEATTNESQCVEDILKEMTHSWPPLLTALHTPSTNEPSKSPLSAKEAESVLSRPVQKSYDSSTSQLHQQNLSSFKAFEAAHSSGVESVSSSDSESSSRSESDSESATEEPPQPTVDSSVKAEPDAPAVSHGDWQLVNWIRSNHQNSSTESQGGALVSKSPAHKQLQPTQKSRQPTVDVVDPTRGSKVSSHQTEINNNIAKLQQSSKIPQDNCHQQSSQESTAVDPSKLQCKTHSSKPEQAACPDHTEAVPKVNCEEAAATREKDPCFTDRPKVKTKTRHSKKRKDSGDTENDTKRTVKRMSLDKRKALPDPEPEATTLLSSHCPSCGVRYPNPCSCPIQNPAQPDQLSQTLPVKVSCSKRKAKATCHKVTKMPHKTAHKELGKTDHTSQSSGDFSKLPTCLIVTIDLNLLSRVPQASSSHREAPSNTKKSASFSEQDGLGTNTSTVHKSSKKTIAHNAVEDKKCHPRKKQKLDNKKMSSAHASVKLECSSNLAEGKDQKSKKPDVRLHQSLTTKESKLHIRSSEETQQSIKDSVKRKDSYKQKRGRVKQTEQPRTEKKPSKSSLPAPSSTQSNKETPIKRPLLRFEDRQYPVKHYIKEAKRLKHKADAELDKLSKAFNYLDAAMYFVESGIAMEKDPQISTSSYTMFAETVELLKFVLKLKNTVDPSAPSSENDFLALCLKCQSLLQMAMFRHKQKAALDYSKTLTDHFSTSALAPHNPSVLTSKVTDTPASTPSMLSPTKISNSSGSGNSHSVASSSRLDAGSSTLALPKDVEQVAFSYISITTLFLRAHDHWEQADELAHKGSGMLTELDTVLGPLSLSSSMTTMVRYTRQGVHWLRLDSKKLK